MFNSSVQWHLEDGAMWVVLAFTIDILSAPGVVFTTSNNAYPTTHRAEGLAGFDQMFVDRVPWGYYGSVRRRYSGIDPSVTTDPQAEVLYPFALSLDRLATIYVRTEDCLERVEGILSHFPPTAPILLAPEVFA